MIDLRLGNDARRGYEPRERTKRLCRYVGGVCLAAAPALKKALQIVVGSENDEFIDTRPGKSGRLAERYRA